MLFEAFRKMRIERPDMPAFHVAAGDHALPISWRQFTDDIETIAHLVKTHSPGATIAILGENSYEWIVVHAAVVFSGAKAVSLDVNASAEEIAEMTAFVGAGVMVHSALYAEKAAEIARLRPKMTVRAFGARVNDSFVADARRQLENCEGGIFSQPPPDVKAVSMLIFTSGTTSQPRAVQQTLEALETCCAVWSERLDMKAGDRSLMVLPLHHVFGICTVYLMLLNGVAVGVCPDFRRLYDAVERFRADFLFLVPALADILAGKIESRAGSAEKSLGVSLRWILTGGAPLSMKTFERLKRLGIRTISAYGLTETASLYSVSPVDDTAHPCGAGRTAEGYGVETKVSASGELLIRGPNVFKGYFKEAALTAEVIDSEGWFHTGDVGEIDKDGFVEIKGRISRTIVLSSGKKIAPEELEGRIGLLPGVSEVVVSGVGDSRDIKAEVYASIPADKVREMIHKLNLQLPVYKRIREVVVRGSPFPRTASGKIKYQTGRGARTRASLSRRDIRLGRMRFPFAWSLSLCLAAVLVAALTIVPNLLASGGVVLPLGFARLFGVLDIVGELMLAALAIVFIFKIERDSDK
jgi:long-chain acyl-CoA synthetase